MTLALVCHREEFRLFVECRYDLPVVGNEFVEDDGSFKAHGGNHQRDGEELVQIHGLLGACGVFVLGNVEFAGRRRSVINPAAFRGGHFPSPEAVFHAVAHEGETDPDAAVGTARTIVRNLDGNGLCAGEVRDLLEFDVCTAIVQGGVGHGHHHVLRIFLLGSIGAEVAVFGRCWAHLRGGGGFGVVVPAGHLVERDDAFVGEVLLPHASCSLTYKAAIPARGFVPRHPPAPGGTVIVHLVHVGNRTVLAKRENLVRAALVRKVDKGSTVALVIVGTVVNVYAQYIVVGFARRPGKLGGILRVKVPDEVVHAVLEHHALVHQLVNLVE